MLFHVQARYQGVDWRDNRTWECNRKENPFNYARTDPLTLAPMELMFVKVKESMIQLNYPSALAAVMYDMWQSHVSAVRLVRHLNSVFVLVWYHDSPRAASGAA